MDFTKALQEGDPLDYGLDKLLDGKIESAKKDFERFEDEIQKMVLEVEKIDIGGEKDAAYLTSVIVGARSLSKKLEELRKKITGSAYEFYRKVMNFEKHYTNQIDSGIIRPGKRKLEWFEHQRELERRKAEKAAREAQEKKQAELDAIAKEQGTGKVTLDAPVVPQETAPIRAGGGSASFKTEWTYDMVDKEKVPRKYCVPDHKKIMEAIRSGKRKIAGIRIYEKTVSRIRT